MHNLIAIYIYTYIYKMTDYLPAVTMDLKQDFWSMRGQSTYLAFGRCCFMVNIHRTRDIPVAIGTTKQLFVEVTPTKKDI